MTTKRDKIVEWVRWGLAVLVVPLAIWGVKLEVNNAVQNERIEKLQAFDTTQKTKTEKTDGKLETLEQAQGVHKEQIKRLQDDMRDTRALRDAIQANTNALGKVEVKIDAVYRNLSEIRILLRQP